MNTILIPPNGPLTIGPDPFNMRRLQESVGGYCQRVSIGDPEGRPLPFGTHHRWVTMLVNEDGRLLPDQQFNPRASYLYGVSIHGGEISGTAVLLGEILGAEGPEFSVLPTDYSQLEWWNKFFDDRRVIELFS